MKATHSLIIGGTRGLGRALVKILAEENHVLSVIGRRSPSETSQLIPNVHHWIVDLLDREHLSVVLAEIIGQNGKLNNLIFLQRYRGQEDDWIGEIDTTLTATKCIIERLTEEFDETGGKSIVIASSVFGRSVGEGQALSYHIAKAGLDQMIRYYAVALGPRGIRVNGVSPFTFLKEESKDFYLQNKELYSLYQRIVPLGRMGTAEEIANVVVFLCSPMASFITGQSIVVDGGLSLVWQESLARKLTSGT